MDTSTSPRRFANSSIKNQITETGYKIYLEPDTQSRLERLTGHYRVTADRIIQSLSSVPRPSTLDQLAFKVKSDIYFLIKDGFVVCYKVRSGSITVLSIQRVKKVTQSNSKPHSAQNVSEPSVMGFIKEEGLNVVLRTGQAVGGMGQVFLGGAICYGSGTLACVIGAAVAAKGADNMQAGIRGTDSLSQQALTKATDSETTGTLLNAGLDLGTSVSGLARSVPKINSLGNPVRPLFRKDSAQLEPAFKQATTFGLSTEALTSTTTIIDTMD